jgi:dihydrolipoamide dehydrogenase
MYDLIIIGGGPGGYLAAERAGGAGLNVLLIEKRALGGVCLNEGCVPSKTLLHSAKVYDYAKNGEAYGVTTTGAKLDHPAVIKRKNKVVDTLVSGVKGLMKANKVTVVYGEANILDTRRVKVGAETYEGARMIIATGSEALVPPIDGVKDGVAAGFVLTNREILDLDHIPENLVIVGGGVIGLEMAAYFNSAGSKVTVIEMLPKIAGATDDDISKILMNNYAKKGVEFKLNTKVTAVGKDSVSYENAEGKAEVKADKVLLSIGRKPVTTGFGLENTGVITDRGAIKTDNNCLTSVPNIYAVGDVNGKYMLAHAAYREAEVAVNHMLGKRDVMRYDAIPSVIYTNPEVAGVGETEATAKAKGLEVESVTVPMMYSGRYVAENSVTDGICKVIIEKKHKTIIGVHMIGSYASEMILSAGIMIELKMRVDDVKELIFPHPTVCEVIREAVFKL